MKKPVQLPDVEPVKLPSVLGVRPGVYILVISILLVALAVFLIGFLPGIVHGGKKVTFTSPVSSVAVTVDGIYRGGTPFETFIESGTHEVLFSKDGLTLQTKTVEVGHPVFFTWLAPRKQTVENDSISITEEGLERLTGTFLSEVAAWSAVTDYDDRYHFPPLFSQWASDMAVLSNELAPSTRLNALVEDAWTLSCAFITSATMRSDALIALDILSKAGLPNDTETTGTLLAVAEDLFSDTGGPSSVTGLEGTVLAEKPQPTSLTVGDMTIKGFAYEPAEFVMGDSFPAIWPAVTSAGVPVSPAGFSIAANEVSEYQWALFIESNPYWSKANLQQLIADGQVDEYYLAGIFPTTTLPTNRPIRNISYRAAVAFCEWLSEASGRNVHLPSEAQWTRAALNVQDKAYAKALLTVDTDESSPSAMLGGVWEFTSTPFLPLARLGGAYERLLGIADTFSLDTDRIVKGGSFVNSPSDIGIDTVGAIEPNACGEYTGMRIAWE
ncbi:MAG: formylglycine-generating enzyme family protein [Sphaerochaetaceae bacterium]|jgi:hypothetical protein